MKYKKLFVGVAAVLHAGVAGAETPNIENVTLSTEVVEACIDSPPVDDGYGWNGSCTCRPTVLSNTLQLNRPILTHNNTLLYAGRHTAGCWDSGTVAVIDIGEQTSKRGELLSSARAINDKFGNSRGSATMNNDYIAVADDKLKITVFTENDLLEQTILDISNINEEATHIRQMNFINNFLLVEVEMAQISPYPPKDIYIFDTTDWTLAQTLEGVGYLSVNGNDELAVRRINGYPQENVTFEIYQLSASGRPDRIFNSEIYEGDIYDAGHTEHYFSDDYLVFEYNENYRDADLNQRSSRKVVRTFIRDNANNWTVAATDLHLSSFDDPVIKLVGEKFLAHLPYNAEEVELYEYTATNGWTLSQTFPLPFTHGDNFFDTLIADGLNFRVSNHSENESTTILFSHTDGTFINLGEVNNFEVDVFANVNGSYKLLDLTVVENTIKDDETDDTDDVYDGVACVDLDGDGWGWQQPEGLSGRSCRVSASGNGNNDNDNDNGYDGVPCIDSDGDGWGWQQPEGQPGHSCRASSTPGNNDNGYDGAPCLDTDGDGWGWQQPPGLPGRSCITQ